MNTLIHADIFFFISSLGFIIIFALLCVILLQAVSLLKSVKKISEKIEKGIDTIGDDAKELIADLRDSAAFRFIFGTKRKTSRKKE